MWHFRFIPSFSSKRGHVTEKHVLNGRKRDKLGNQTFEVLRLLKRTVYTIPFTYFTWLSHSHHLNHLISEILERGIPGLKFRQYLCIENISTNSKAFQLWRESLPNGRRTSNVWLPSLSRLRPVRTCFLCHVSTLRWKRRYAFLATAWCSFFWLRN